MAAFVGKRGDTSRSEVTNSFSSKAVLENALNVADAFGNAIRTTKDNRLHIETFRGDFDKHLNCNETPIHKTSALLFRDCSNQGLPRDNSDHLVHIENSSGHFERIAINDCVDRNKHQAIQHDAGERRENVMKSLTQESFKIYTFAQGSLSGLSINSLLFNLYLDSELIDHPARALRGQRMFIVLSSICLSGATLRGAHIWHESSILTQCAKITTFLLYFTSTVLSLSIARATFLMQSKGEEVISNEELKLSLQEFSTIILSRSICCVLGWSLVCCGLVSGEGKISKEGID